VLDRFTLQTTNALGGTAAIDTLRVTGSANFTAANVTDVKVSCDAEGIIPSTATAIAGNVTTLTFPTHLYVTNTAKNCSVLVDIAPAATVGQAFTGVVTTPATGHGLGTPTYNDTGSATLTIKQYAYKVTSCGQCHGYPPADGTRSGATGAVVGDHQVHNYVCSTCHVAPATETSADYGHRTGGIQMQASIAGGSYSKASPITQVNNPTTGTCSNISCHGGNNPTPVWGVGTATCTSCHSGTITRTKGVPGGTLDPITGASGEFGLAWGHKKLGRTTVADADCIVCHLEGNYTTQKTSSYHADGNIDLRDPDVQGETPITNISGGAFTFQKFSMSFAAGSRSTALSDASIADVISQKFCLKCHDGGGAANTTARSNNGGTGTAAMPFGGIALGANYTATNGAIGTQGLIDVAGQFATTNSSWHPVMGPKNRDYPTAVMLADPYKPTGTRGTSGTLSQGVVLNCFDCHNVAGTPLTDRTVAAHGNAVTLRGVATVSGTPSASNGATFCGVCHIGQYGKAANNHGTGSAFTTNTNGTMTAYVNYGCNICHGSRYTTAVVRPVRAQDIHGSNVVPTGTQTKAGRWAGGTKNGPIAFIRNNYDFNDHAPLNITGTVYTPACMGGSSAETTACQRGVENYTPGGTY
jgi:predicted CxxxxCH...CXXCH cytochrome family protein